MNTKPNQAEALLDEAVASAKAAEVVAQRRESEIVSLDKSDIRDLLPANERAQKEAQAAEFERLWQERRKAKE